MGEYSKARHEYEMVMSGKGLEISHKKGKGKVSLQVSRNICYHAARIRELTLTRAPR